MEPRVEYPISASGLSIRLLKVPTMIAERWKYAKPGETLGTVTRLKGMEVFSLPNTRGDTLMHTSEEQNTPPKRKTSDLDPVATPRKFRLRTDPASETILLHFMPASEDRPASVRTEGRVVSSETLLPLTKTGILAPRETVNEKSRKPVRMLQAYDDSGDSGYAEMIAKPVLFQYARRTQPYDAQNEGVSAGRTVGEGGRHNEGARPATDAANPALDPDELKQRLFQHFEQQPRWSLRDLQMQTRQPHAALKAALEEIARVARDPADNRVKYTLKPEFTVQ